MILNFLVDETPLFYACLNENTDIVQILLDNSANIFIKDTESKTPLDLAVETENDDIIDLFVLHCVEVIVVVIVVVSIHKSFPNTLLSRKSKIIFL